MTIREDVRRFKLERETMANMIKMYCSGNHNCSLLCVGCEELIQYAKAKLRANRADGYPKCPVFRLIYLKEPR
jgi:hypothetical protein